MSAPDEGRVVVGVSEDSWGWPVFRIRDMEDTEPETVQRYRKRIEDALNEEPFDWRGLRGEILAGDLYLTGPDGEVLPEEAVREIFDHYLEAEPEPPGPVWPEGLETNVRYQRFEDDSKYGSLSVVFSEDGDAWVDVFMDPDERPKAARFRTGLGGGESPEVRKALMRLALAIKADNEADPQRRGDS